MMKQDDASTGTPFFSIVIPCYGAERFIQTTLDSIYAQTEQDYEIVVVHDESPDGTLDILRAQTDTRLRVIDQQNEGECGARNRGIREARGRYVAFLDSDDAWLPHHLSLARTFFEQHPDLAWYASQHKRVTDISTESFSKSMPKEVSSTSFQVVRWFLEGDGRTRPSCVVARRSALPPDPFPMGVKMHGDTIGWVRLAKKEPLFGCTDEVTMLYRVWGGSASDNYLRAFSTPQNNVLTLMGELARRPDCTQEERLFYQEFDLVNWWQRLSHSSLITWIDEVKRRREVTGSALAAFLTASIYANHALMRFTRWIVRKKLLFIRKKQRALIAQWSQKQNIHIRDGSSFCGK